MSTLEQRLAAQGIHHASSPGEHRTACPKCNKGKGDTALAVKVEHYSAVWTCHRCEWKGGTGEPVEGPDDDEHLRHWSVSEQARTMWSSNRPAPSGEHLYLRSKGVPPYGIRWNGNHLLLVPMYTAPDLPRVRTATLWNIQTISTDGTKRFLKGGRVKGCFHMLGGFENIGDKIIIAEGFATAASIYRATEVPTAIAFNCGNLEPVARAIRNWRPDAHIVIAADDDWRTDGNPGLTKAQAAAELIGAAVAVPAFPDPGRRGTDFNDLDNGAVGGGTDLVRKIILEAMDNAPEPRQPPPEGKDGKPAPVIAPINFTALPDEEPPPRKFLVDQWLPMGCLSSLYGPGGVGKSLLAQQIATCIATGLSVLGADVTQCPVLGLFAEDDDDELIRRQWRMNQTMGLRNRDLGGLHIQGRAGLDNCIATFPMGAPHKDALFEVTIAKAKEIGAGLIILDNRAQMLLVNENDRAQATFAANLCAGIGREANGAAVLLIGHVAKATGSEYSGSTAWDAVTRSRWHLYRAPDDEEEAEKAKTEGAGIDLNIDPPELILLRAKSNYAPPDMIRLAWASGLFRPVDAGHLTSAEVLDLKLRQGAACQAFLDCLDRLTAQGRPLSHSQQAKNYAPKIMAPMIEGFARRELERAMEQLFSDGRIHANAPVVLGADRKWKTGVARVNCDPVRDSSGGADFAG